MLTDRYPDSTYLHFQTDPFQNLIQSWYIIQYFNCLDSTTAHTEMSFHGKLALTLIIIIIHSIQVGHFVPNFNT